MDDSRLRFFRADALARVRQLHIAVVGAGGTGSHIIQQLAHLQVGRIIAIDPDTLEISNVNRVVLGNYRVLGRPKCQVLAHRLRRLKTDIVPIVAPVESADAIAALQTSDLCFGAVDHFGTRQLIEYFARMALVPVIDVGTQITPRTSPSADGGAVVSAGGQIVTSIPGEACFWCMRFLTDELVSRERVRYGDGGAQYAQQVISVNGVLASQAITNMLGLYAEFVGPSGVTRYVAYNALTQEMRAHPNLVGLDLSKCGHYAIKEAGWFVR